MRPEARYVLGAVGACLLVASGLIHAQDMVPPAAPADHAWSAGEKTYAKWCGDCHSTDSGPGSLALQRKYRGNPPAVLEQRNDLTVDYVREVVRHGISFMPSFRKTEISDAELALLADYLTSPAGRPHRMMKRR